MAFKWGDQVVFQFQLNKKFNDQKSQIQETIFIKKILINH